MDLLKELMQLDEAKKKTSLKKAARSVYHRDYVKTKNKPYRKYDKKKRQNQVEESVIDFDEVLDEGMWDYIKGAGSLAGNKFKSTAREKLNQLADAGERAMQPIKDIHAAGQQASVQGDVKRIVLQMGEATDKIREIKKRLDSLGLQQQNEGVFDYLKGAGRTLGQQVAKVPGAIQRTGQAVGRGIKDAHSQGRAASLQGNLQKWIAYREQLAAKLVALTPKVGDPKRMVAYISKLFGTDVSTASTVRSVYTKMYKHQQAQTQGIDQSQTQPSPQPNAQPNAQPNVAPTSKPRVAPTF